MKKHYNYQAYREEEARAQELWLSAVVIGLTVAFLINFVIGL